jgi:hypothetical protein
MTSSRPFISACKMVTDLEHLGSYRWLPSDRLLNEASSVIPENEFKLMGDLSEAC